MSPMRWYRSKPRWVQDRILSAAAGTVLVYVLGFRLASALLAQNGGGVPDDGLVAFLERNMVALTCAVGALFVGLNRISRLERDQDRLRRDHEAHKIEVTKGFVPVERWDDHRELLEKRHYEVLARIEGLHGSIREIRRGQLEQKYPEGDA